MMMILAYLRIFLVTNRMQKEENYVNFQRMWTFNNDKIKYYTCSLIERSENQTKTRNIS